MRKRELLLVLVTTLAALLTLPALAYGGLVNEYGMSFAGQAKCLECHDGSYGQTVHGRFAKTALVPAVPSGWTVFKAAGDPPVVPGTLPALYNGGGSYAIAQPWITLGDYAGGSATEYLFWKGSADPTVNPWNLVEGLGAESDGHWNVGADDPTLGLYDVQYGCQRCHMLGTTFPSPNAISTVAIPNPQASTPVTFTTGKTWARDEAKTVAQFGTDQTVSTPGMSIQCEACHGTGFKATTDTKHWNSGTQLSHRMPATGGQPASTLSTLGQSQVCGQCHGSYTTVPGTLGIYGYTPNLPLRLFVDINGAPTGKAAYTYRPTEAEFMANPSKYYLFPNGSNAAGSHFYYDEWATSGHAYRGALGTSGPDVLPGGTHGHYNAAGSDLGCAKCHTGENYLKSKNDPLTTNFTPTSANVGFMGQECITCHDSHPSTAFGASNIRTPDAAGVRSNTGLQTANTSVCEDCHNWQNEVLGATPVVKPQASLASRGGPSHPQRETLHGKVMVEVPVAGEFMPGAKCQDCHMPVTNKAANRFSHGMHVMMPGKAKIWNAAAGVAYKGGDSCTPCHAGETQDQLQANIDTWQGNAHVASDTAAAAITAAMARAGSEFSLTDATKPGYILVGKATWNFKAYGMDASQGMHNPEYAVAGLNVATKMAKSTGGSIGVVFASSSVAAGNLGYVSGRIVNGDGTGAADGKLTLLGGTGGTTQSDANGNFSFAVSPVSTTTFQVRWERSSDPITHLLSSSSVMNIVGSISPMKPVYRFLNMRTGTYLWTADEMEKNSIVANLGATYRLEGVAYMLDTASPDMIVPLYRFLNLRTGTYLWTADAAEKNNIVATMGGTYRLEGVAWNVSQNPAGAPVWRFLNLRTGTYFWTADAAEKNNIVATMGGTYRLEGVAYYLAP